MNEVVWSGASDSGTGANAPLLERQRRAAIEGAAGTGKTILAEPKATRLAAAGQRVLLLCFNQALAGWLASRAAGFEARSFHGFCRERATAAGLSFKAPRTEGKPRDGNPKSCSDSHLYVAPTRARALLIVLEEARAAP